MEKVVAVKTESISGDFKAEQGVIYIKTEDVDIKPELFQHCQTYHEMATASCNLNESPSYNESEDIKHEELHYQTDYDIQIVPHTITRSRTNDSDYSAHKLNLKQGQKKRIQTRTRQRPLERMTAKQKFACNLSSNDYKILNRDLFVKYVKWNAEELAFVCNVCDCKSADTNVFIKHVEQHMEASNTCINNKAKHKELLKTKKCIRHSEPKEIICNICDYRPKKGDCLVCHMEMHSERKPYACSICDFRSKYKHDLNTHSLMHTEEEYRFSCDVCQFKSHQKCSLQLHNIAMHSVDKHFACNICDYRTKFEHCLKKHVSVHSIL